MEDKLKSTDRKRFRLERLWNLQEGKCYYCDKLTVMSERGCGDDRYKHDKATIDHRIPRCRAKGLKNNIVVACERCNKDKASRKEFKGINQ